MDSNPLSARGEGIINAYREAFANGLTVISHLTSGKVYVCQAPRTSLPTGEGDNIQAVEFSGPHPSGLVGTHIHFLNPVSENKTVWHLGYQDIIAIGKLFTTGRLWTERIIPLGGPGVREPALIRTRLGANIAELVEGQLNDFACRVISGSILSGHHAHGPSAFLGRYHNQISVIGEEVAVDDTGGKRTSSRLFSTYSLLVSGRPLKSKFNFTSAKNGPVAPLVPLGGYERVMPLDILPTPLIRALMVGDTDMAQALGCLELDEEDMALIAFVCPSKINHGRLLRLTLERLEKQR
jgi:Na+-transporting NADH:ubiquinone oxidoreductase subunit A